MQALIPSVASLSKFLTGLVSPFENLGTRVAAWLARLGLLSPALAVVVSAIKGLGVYLLMLGTWFSIKALTPFLSAMAGVATATDKADRKSVV